MAKKFLYRGKPTEELAAMPLDQFVKLLPSGIRRTLTRMSPKIKHFLERIRKAKPTGKILKTQIREMPILPEMVGMRFKVYNGKDYQDIMVGPEMIGRRMGEYAITIKMVKHSGPGIGATRGSKSVDLK